MKKVSQINKDNNIEHTITCKACGHSCKQVYIVKNGSINSVMNYGEQFIVTMDKVVYTKDNKATGETVYMCPKCGILQTEVCE